MFRFKRAWWVLILCSLALLSPREGSAVFFDPYARRNLTGHITLEYEKYTSEEDAGFEEQIDTFHQFYSLDLRGNLFSRSLIIYDLGVSWDSEKYSTDFQEFDTTILYYSLSTTLLPLSRIPLTLYANRSESDTSGSSPTDLFTTTFGMRWLLDFWTLPRTNLSMQKRLTQGSGNDSEDSLVSVNLQKVVGPTDNTLEYRYDVDEDRNSTDPSSRKRKEQTYNFTNTTDLSRYTNVRLGYVHNIVTHPEDHTEDIFNQGLSAFIDSTPSDDFHQTHSYIWHKRDRETGTESVGQFYNGSMSYNITSRLDSTASLGINDTRNTDPQNRFESKSFSTSGALNYRPTAHLQISEVVSLVDITTNTEQGKANLGKRKTFRANSLVRYSRDMKWFRLTSQYSAGYVQDEADVEGEGTGVDQGVSLGLSGIDVLKYVAANVYGSYYTLESITGPIWERRVDYHASVYNLKGTKYAILNFYYDKSNESGYLEEILNRELESFRATALSRYFKNTNISLSAERSNRVEDLAGEGTTTSGSASASHSRRLLGGMLNLSASYRIVRAISSDSQDTTKSTTYRAKYRRPLLRRVLWELEMERVEEDFKNVTEGFSNTTRVNNSLAYLLRAWQLRAEYTWDKTETDFFDRTDNTLYLKATRSFRRFF